MATGSRECFHQLKAIEGARPFLSPTLLLGFNAQIIQLVLFRETLMLSSGSEVSLGLSLAAWGLFNGAGSFTGWAALKFGLRPGRLFSGLLFAMPFLLALCIHLARISRAFTDVPGGEQLRLALFTGLAVLILAPVTFVDGFMFVCALDALFKKKAGGRDTSFVYGTESLGSLAGGLVFSLALVFFLNAFAIAALLLGLNALILHTPSRGRLLGPSRLRSVVRLLLVLCGGLGLAFSSEFNNASEQRRWKVLQPDLKLVESRESRYQNLAVLKYLEDYSLYGNGHLLFTLRSESAAEYGDWDRAIPPNFAMLQHSAPRNIVMVGGGSSGYLKDLLEYDPERVDWVEYDQEMVDLVDRFMIPEEREGFSSSRVRFFATDGRHFVKHLPPGGVDLILVDVPDPANANLNRYYTLEFFRECRRALSKDGVLVTGLSCQPNYIGEDMLRRNGSVYAALRAVFPRVLITPGEFSFMAAGGEDVRLSADGAELLRRYESRGIQSDRFSPYLFYTWFEEDDVRWINEEIFAPALEEGRFHPNLDNRPLAYIYDSSLFASITGSPGEEGLARSVETYLSGGGEGVIAFCVRWLAGIFPLLGLLLYLGFRMRSRSRGGIASRRLLLLLVAAATGFSGIILEMGVLFSFQNQSGHLYSQMGVIMAAYMAGLALGALWPFKGLSPRAVFGASIACMAGGVFALVFLLPLLADVLPGGGIPLVSYALVTLLLGAAGGLSFRGVSLGLEGAGGAGGGMIYTMDILGTCLGGWQAGNILIPFLGIQTALLAAGSVTILLCILCLGVLNKEALP